jgi:transcriptional/translational regulatory protein YebC/TACO1
MFVNVDDLPNQTRALKDKDYDIQMADTVWLPLVEGQQLLERPSEQAQNIQKLLSDLEAEEDVTGVYSNVIFRG